MARRLAAATVLSCFWLMLAGGQTQNAKANGDTRTISLYHSHTEESLTVTFKRDGQFDREALRRLNRFLRDWRRDEEIEMDPRLFDLLWEVYREVGSREPVNVVSAYRSPATNSMLRSRSRGVARYSQHTQGKAMDFYLTDVSMTRVRELGMKKQRGGVGFYPSSANHFVHLDVGSVRSWPRMTRDQLSRLFPDGNTIHIPADGRPMPGFEQTLARIGVDGKGGGGALAFADPSERGGNWLARLFGFRDAEEGDEEYTALPPRQRRAQALAEARRARQQGQQVATAPATTAAETPQPVFGIGTLFGQPEPVIRPGGAAAPARPTATPVAPAAPAAAPAQTATPATPPPLPLARPTDLTPRVADVPLPPQRPDLRAATPQIADVPLPPERPRQFALLSGGTASLAMLPAAEAPSLAPVALSPPPLRPSRPEPAGPRIDQTAMRAPPPLPQPNVTASIAVTQGRQQPAGDTAPRLHAPWSYGPLLTAEDGGAGRRLGTITAQAVQPLVGEARVQVTQFGQRAQPAEGFSGAAIRTPRI
jgi:uncharacterized protein YcbK (DUF882 family)